MNKKARCNLFLKITKVVFLLFLGIFTILFVLLFAYFRKIDYYMPKISQIEIYDKDDNLIRKSSTLSNGTYVTIDQISENVIKAIISIEDKEFYNHQGINLKRMIGALLVDLKKGAFVQGGSTITQQYVKNTFLSSSKTLKRKLDEAMIAINIEAKYTKDEILEAYLNTIYFDHGITGIYDASLFYFNKTPDKLTLNEACVLCAIPKSPANLSPIKNVERNNERRKLILNELLTDNKISTNDYNSVIDVFPEIYGIKNNNNISSAPYYIDLVISEVKKLNILNNKVVKVYTTLDLRLNEIIENKINKYYTNENFQIALVCFDTKGNLLANVGGIDYEKSSYNRTFALRQPGSTIKPFLYYTAFKEGFNITSTFLSAPTSFNIDGETYNPENYGNIYPNQNVSMAYAIATSDNIYAIKTHLFLGTNALYNTLIDFGFTSKLNNNASLALGTSEVTLYELTLAYAKLASLGYNLKANIITKALNENDKILYTYNDKASLKYDEMSCYLLSNALTNTFDSKLRINTSPTCAMIDQFLTSTYACKTGSTDYDGLIVGYNKNVCLGIWTGRDDNKEITNAETKYIRYIWATIMEEYNNDKENSWYDIPNDVVAIKLDPIDGSVDNHLYKKYLYYDKDNLPEIIQ